MQKEGECVSFYSEEHDGSYEIMEADELPLLQPQPQLASAHNNIKQSCCRSQCLQQLHSTELETIRMSFTCRSRIQQKQFLIDILHVTVAAASNNEGSRCKFLKLYFNGKSFCRKAFIKLLGISMQRLRAMQRLVNNGVRVIPTEQHCHSLATTEKYQSAKAWMSHYFNQIGDRMPHIEQLHLPCFLSKKSIYDMMSQDFREDGCEIISRSHYYKLWNTEFTHVSIPKVNAR